MTNDNDQVGNAVDHVASGTQQLTREQLMTLAVSSIGTLYGVLNEEGALNIASIGDALSKITISGGWSDYRIGIEDGCIVIDDDQGYVSKIVLDVSQATAFGKILLTFAAILKAAQGQEQDDIS